MVTVWRWHCPATLKYYLCLNSEITRINYFLEIFLEKGKLITEFNIQLNFSALTLQYK